VPLLVELINGRVPLLKRSPFTLTEKLDIGIASTHVKITPKII
jgi:hypothetical protein